MCAGAGGGGGRAGACWGTMLYRAGACWVQCSTGPVPAEVQICIMLNRAGHRWGAMLYCNVAQCCTGQVPAQVHCHGSCQLWRSLLQWGCNGCGGGGCPNLKSLIRRAAPRGALKHCNIRRQLHPPGSVFQRSQPCLHKHLHPPLNPEPRPAKQGTGDPPCQLQANPCCTGHAANMHATNAFGRGS